MFTQGTLGQFRIRCGCAVLARQRVNSDRLSQTRPIARGWRANVLEQNVSKIYEGLSRATKHHRTLLVTSGCTAFQMCVKA